VQALKLSQDAVKSGAAPRQIMRAGGHDTIPNLASGYVANAKGRNLDAAGEFCAWALASMDKGSIQRVADWCTKGKSDMPLHDSALMTAPEAFSTGMIGTFAKEIHPGTRAEPCVPPEVYKIISDAIQQTQLGDADPQAAATAASQQLDAFLASYSGAPTFRMKIAGRAQGNSAAGQLFGMKSMTSVTETVIDAAGRSATWKRQSGGQEPSAASD